MVENKPWYQNSTIPTVLLVGIFGIMLLNLGGYIDLPHIDLDNEEDYPLQPGNCPTVPDPPCGTTGGAPGEIQHTAVGVYVLSHCNCPEGTHFYADVGETIYCECDGAQ